MKVAVGGQEGCADAVVPWGAERQEAMVAVSAKRRPRDEGVLMGRSYKPLLA